MLSFFRSTKAAPIGATANNFQPVVTEQRYDLDQEFLKIQQSKNIHQKLDLLLLDLEEYINGE